MHEVFIIKHKVNGITVKRYNFRNRLQAGHIHACSVCNR